MLLTNLSMTFDKLGNTIRGLWLIYGFSEINVKLLVQQILLFS